MQRWTVQNRLGKQLHAVKFLTPATPRAIFIFNHGYGEHSGAYATVFESFAVDGIETWTFDMQGCGLSEMNVEERSKMNRFEDPVNDLEDFCLSAKEAHDPSAVPFFVGGTSLGALIATTMVLRRQEMFRGLLLFSPALDVDWTLTLRLQAPIGGLLAAMVPWKRLVPAVRVEDMSQDPAVRQAYVDDPLNYVGNVRSRTANCILQGMRALKSKYSRVQLPVYGLHGSLDTCTSVPAHRIFMDTISSKDKTLWIVEGGYHMLLKGPEKERCTKAAKEWILQRATPQPPASKI